MTSIFNALALTTTLLSPPAAAPPPAATVAPLTAAAQAIARAPLAGDPQFAVVVPSDELRRPKALLPMYAAFVALQGYDVYSTTRALNGGAVEANPLMRKLVKTPAAFLSLKAALTASSIFGAERLWRTGHRKAAVVLMAVTGGLMTVAAVNNARVLRQLR